MKTIVYSTYNLINKENCEEYISEREELIMIKPNEPKYTFGDYVKCMEITKENVEKLQRGKVYIMTGNSILNGNVVYAVKDEVGNLFYSIDRFEKVGHSKVIEMGMMQTKKEELNTNKDSEYDAVQKPKHYNQYRVEVIDIIEDATKNLTGLEAVCVANALKYVLRYQFKNGLEDINKAIWYLNKLVSTMTDVEDVPVNSPITEKQLGYIVGLTKSLRLDREYLPKYISPVDNYKDLTEAEAIRVIDKLIVLEKYYKR